MLTQVDSLDILLENAVSEFENRFNSKPSVAVAAPGRVNLIGDHVDYNEGFVMPMALPMVTLAVGKPNGLSECRIVTLSNSPGTDAPHETSFSLTALSPGLPKWANYVKGVVAKFHEPSALISFDAVFISSVPVGGGLSSSAALEVCTYTLLEALTKKIAKTQEEKALACQAAEHEYASVPCGIMDQMISVKGQAEHALLIDCQSLQTQAVPLALPNIAVLIIDSGVRHQLSGSEYPLRRGQCQKAAQILNVPSLRHISIDQLQSSKDLLDEETYRRALHVVQEIEYTRQAAEAARTGDLTAMGKLMNLSHISLRDLYNVSCPEVDALVDAAINCEGVLGSRMTGGGFGGCAVALVLEDCVSSTVQRIKAQNPDTKATFYVCRAGSGARQLEL